MKSLIIYFVVAVVFLCEFAGITRAEKVSHNIETLANLSGFLLHAKIKDNLSLVDLVKHGEPTIEVLDKQDGGRRWGYFKVRISVVKYLNLPQERSKEGLREFDILVPAARVGERWSMMYPQIDQSDVLLVVDNMELGFKQFICLKYVSRYSEEIEKKVLKMIKQGTDGGK
jgi:hypothetical protein